jgi:acetyl-CoA C-acetyltransferase
MREVVIVGAARTAIGSFQGALATVAAPKLGGVAIQAALQRAGLGADAVDEVLMGCVLPAGLGQAPARQAALAAGLPQGTPCTTLNKVCGSGLKAVMMATQAIRAGDADVIVAGGMENMSLAPYYLPGARDGYRMGHQQVIDGLIKDGLWDVYNDFHMGNAGELCAKDRNITRADQDAFAKRSYEAALEAQRSGAFTAEITPVLVPQKKGDPLRFEADEEPGRAQLSKMDTLRPAFDKNGTITAANASKLNDGAAALVVCSGDYARAHGLTVLARITGQAQHAQAPEWFTTAPAYAIRKVLEKQGLTPNDIDLYEVNEAFAVVSLAVNNLAELPADRVNVNGGAVALGHPIGASGARILVTLLHAMTSRNVKRGLASLCIGGGEAVALTVER